MIGQGNKTIGIIGGMGPLSTVDLFRRIVEMTDSDSDTGHLRVIIDSNTNIPDRTAAILDGGLDPVPEMTRAALNLERGGADVLIMGCNTAHYYYPDLCRFVRVPFLNMLEETAKEARARGYRSVGLLATDGTVCSKVYTRALNTQQVGLLLPDAAGQQALMEMVYQGVKAGQTAWQAEPITRLMDDLAQRGADAIILGCTELPLAFSIYRIESALPLLDPTAVLARSAIRFVGGRLRPGV